MRFSSVLVLVLAAAAVVASPAGAQRRPTPPPTTPQTPTQTEATSRDQEARMLFEAGRVAYAAGRFEDSLGYFQRAHEMSGRAVLLYNVGSAADKLRRDAVALDAFRRYLEAVPAADNRAEVEARIQVLEQVVATEAARATPTVTETTNTTASGETATGETHAASGETEREGEIAASLGARGSDTDDTRDSGSIFGTWWFWTIVGVVVVGGTIAAIAAASSGGGLGPLQPGDDGSVYMTLGMP